jgi:hypothetical protein
VTEASCVDVSLIPEFFTLFKCQGTNNLSNLVYLCLLVLLICSNFNNSPDLRSCRKAD